MTSPGSKGILNPDKIIFLCAGRAFLTANSVLIQRLPAGFRRPFHPLCSDGTGAPGQKAGKSKVPFSLPALWAGSFFPAQKKSRYGGTAQRTRKERAGPGAEKREEIDSMMKKRILAALLCLCLAAGLLTGCGNSAASGSQPASSAPASSVPASSAAGQGETRTITDHAGRQVEIPAQVDRVVVTDIYPLPSVLSVFLGSAEKIVGIHPMSMSAAQTGTLGEIFPEILEADTSFMTGTELNVESLLALEPDLVFCNASNAEEMEAITNAGIPCVGVATGKWNFDILETYAQWTALLGEIFPESDKSALVREYSEEVYQEVQDKVADLEEGSKKKILFLYQYDENTMVTSSSKFFGQFWCEAVGGVNVASEVPTETSNAVITMEQVYQWNPDVIFITNFTECQPEDLYTNAINGDDWSSVAAVQNQQVYKMPLGTYRTYTPSSDTPLTLLWLAQKVYPEKFADLDLNARVKEYYSEIYGVELTDEQVEAMYNPPAEAAAGRG